MPPISSALFSGADSQDGGAVGPYLTQALQGLECGKRVFNIDPPTSPNAIMQRAQAPTAERTVTPAGASRESLTCGPGD